MHQSEFASGAGISSHVMTQSGSGARVQKRPRYLLILPVACAVLCLVVATAAGFVAPGFGKAGAASEDSHVTRRALQQLERTRQSSEWRLGLGRAMDVLRKDMVAIFGKDPHTPDFSIYSEQIQVVDARAPSFQLNGLQSYQRILETMQWTVRTTCEHSHMEITSMSAPVNNEVYIRWRLTLWPKDVLAPAKGFLAPLFERNPLRIMGIDMPFTVEGYSRYEFDPWSAIITKHTLDITNPPTYIMDLIRQYSQAPAWLTPVSGVPSVMPRAMAERQGALLASTTPFAEGAAFAGASAPKPQATASQVVTRASSWIPSLPQTCEDDFECNDGKANFPLQCCEIPLLGNFCCEPDDYQPIPQSPAYVPLPVPVEDDPWQQR